jgi:hypothetical protein
MPCRLGSLARRVVIVSLLLIGSAPQPSPAPSPAAEDSLSMLPEVRLRKLHLVRPDLIPYPLYYEVCC